MVVLLLLLGAFQETALGVGSCPVLLGVGKARLVVGRVHPQGSLEAGKVLEGEGADEGAFLVLLGEVS